MRRLARLKQISFLIALLLFTAGAAKADFCGKAAEGALNYSYCIHPSPDASNKDLLLHFHGLGGGANTWKNARNYQRVRQHILNSGKSLPTVITISFGKLWLLTEVVERNNRYGVVMNKILPYLEALAGFDGRGRRLLLGESMGGFNALQMFLKNPGRFARVAIICPAVADLTPWATQAELQDYIRRTGASPLRVAFFMDVAADEFPTAADWDAHNPLLLAKSAAITPTAVYLSGDEFDEYGFFEGATLLHRILKRKTRDYQWDPVIGGRHCQMHTANIARFLSQP